MEQRTKPTTVLVADDQEDMRALLLVILSNAGYSVIEAADGIAAIEMACEQQPDVILLDVSMPVMNGLEVLKRLRENPVTRSIPVIMVTASQGLDTESKVDPIIKTA